MKAIELPSYEVYEDEPRAISKLSGLALVRSDLGEFVNEPNFDFDCEVTMIDQTGSRPWCVISALHDEWSGILDKISDEYKVHLLQVNVDDLGLEASSIARLVSDVRDELATAERFVGETSVYGSGEEMSIISHEHLSVFLAKSVMATVDERIEAILSENHHQNPASPA